MLEYTLRIRDLVHGTILFTECEQRVINHPYFQRLRQVRQNDVAFYVFPSLNTSRFEHVLGTCRVAGMMAETLTKSPKWRAYFRELKAQTGIASKEEFVEIARLYAILHDIGHLPLSHLFEFAVEDWIGTPNFPRAIEEWAGVGGFKKLHEAFSAAIVRQIVSDLKLSRVMRNALLRLMTEKDLLHQYENPLSVIKSLVDSDIDADRIDFVQRDGLLAGGEYGHYDIRRLCDAVFIEQYDGEWRIAYSEKALTSMEALLLDRYRTHVWIHFHHRVVAMKMLVRFLIQKALEFGVIKKEHFDPTKADEFSLRDDVWLWGILRNMEADGEVTRMIQHAVFYREKRNVLNLWKTRPEYHELREVVADRANVNVTALALERPEAYQSHLSRRLGVQLLMFRPPFEAISKERVRLYSESKKGFTGRSLLEVSRLIANLEVIWKDEPQEFILIVDKNARSRAKRLTERWVTLTADWVKSPRLL